MNPELGNETRFAAILLMRVDYAFLYEVRADGPLTGTVDSPLGPRQYWKIHSATLNGPQLKAPQAVDGSDWMRVGQDGFWRPDVRMALVTDDEKLLYLHYTGLVEQTQTFKTAASQHRPTQFADQHLRITMQFETGEPTCRWLTQSLFIARGRLLGNGHLEYEVYRVS